jgi:hypothetical protein
MNTIDLAVRRKPGDGLIEARSPLRLRVEMQCRVPAARDSQQVAVDGRGAAISGDRPDHDAAQRFPPACADDHAAGVERDRTHDLLCREAWRVAWIDNRRDLGAGLGQCRGAAIGVVIVGKQNGAPARQDGIATDISLDGARQHDPGSVVARKDERPFQRAGREHDLPRPNVPQPQARHSGGRGRPEQLTDALGRDDIIVVIAPERASRRQQPDFRHRRQLGDRLRGPAGAIIVIDLMSPAQQRAAKKRVAVGEYDARAAAAGRKCRRQPGRSGADDEHIAMRVPLIVARRIGRSRRTPEPGHAAQCRLPQIAPQAARPDKGLVIETGWKQRCDTADQRADITVETRPGMLARRLQPVIQRDVGGAAVGFGEVAGLELNQRRGLLRSRREYSARPVVLEAARDEAHAIRQQCRSERVAGVALVLLSVEGEAQNPAAVDLAAARQAKGLGHGPPRKFVMPEGGSPIL